MNALINEVDNLTGINNELYLKKNYQHYINKNKDANFIMIDFEKFKSINDTFGHDIGDNYLILFSKILKSVFSDSIVVRLHGDEFVILTKHDNESIVRRFSCVDKYIEMSVQDGKIPKTFGYNAGVVPAEHGISNTGAKADYMMYHAKKNKMRVQLFDQEILNIKLSEETFNSFIDDSLVSDGFTYVARQMFDKDKVPQNIFQISTRDAQGNSIFLGRNYELLRCNNRLNQIDIYNIQNLIRRLNILDNKMIVSIDYKSLLFRNSFIDYIKTMIDFLEMDFSKIILSINIKGISPEDYNEIIKSINLLKKLDFCICLDKYSSKIGDEIWENSIIDYVKFDNEYWKLGLDNLNTNYVLLKKVDMFSNAPRRTVPIFTYVGTSVEHEFLKKICDNDILLSGDYYSLGKELVLKKDN